MANQSPKRYSLANRSGIIVAVFFLIIISLFGFERYHLEKERILSNKTREIEDAVNLASLNVQENLDLIQSIETGPELDFNEKLKDIQGVVQPIVEKASSQASSPIIVYYSNGLKTLVAISPSEDFCSLLGNSIKLPREKTRASQKLQQKIKGVPLYSNQINCSAGLLQGQMWAFIPSTIFHRELTAHLQTPLFLFFFAIVLALLFANYISRQLKQEASRFKYNLLSLSPNSDFNEVTSSDLPAEFFPLYQQYTQVLHKNQELQQELYISYRLATLGEMMGVIAHNVRNPLCIIKNSAILGLKNPSPHQKDHNLERIIKSGDEINSLLENTLSLLRCPPDERELIGLDYLIREIEEDADLLKDGKNLHLEFQVSPQINPVWGNPLALRQALINVIKNGVEVTPPGGVITVRTTPAEVGGTLITIADNGPGIPPEIRKQIFERFFTTKGKKGTGLGLAMARQIIENHNGKIWAAPSDFRKGAIIKIWLPLPPSS